MFGQVLAVACLAQTSATLYPDILCLLQTGFALRQNTTVLNATGSAADAPPRWSDMWYGRLREQDGLEKHLSFGKAGQRFVVGKKDEPPGVWQAWMVAAVMCLVLILLISEICPPDVVMFVALIIVWNLGIITSAEALSGFSNSALAVVGSLFVVVRGVDRSKLIERTARSTLGTKTSQLGSLVRLCSVTVFFGTCISNAALVALFMPIIRDWARTRQFAPSKFLLPLAYASIGGGTLTLIGTSTNLVINGMLQQSAGLSFSFFDPARVGIMQLLFIMPYLLIVGVRLLPNENGGLFRTLMERKQDMVTELQVSAKFPLVGSSVWEVMDALGIPREALLKIFRQPAKRGAALVRTMSAESPSPPKAEAKPELARFQSSPAMRPGGPPLSYMERTAHCWGIKGSEAWDSRRNRAGTSAIDDLRDELARHRRRSISSGDVTTRVPPLAEERVPIIEVDDPDIREIFPVPEYEVLEGEDVLLLSLPRDTCVDFVKSPQVAAFLNEMAASLEQGDRVGVGTERFPAVESQAARGTGLRLCDLELLDIPGRQGEFMELVISPSNPFVGEDFSGAARHEFEEQYEVKVLAVRKAAWAAKAEGADRDHLLSYANQESSAILRVDSPLFGKSMSVEKALDAAVVTDAAQGANVGAEATMANAKEAKSLQSPGPLKRGDAVLVLARAGRTEQKLNTHEFLAVSTVAQGEESKPTGYDYIPLLLFVIGIVLVASQQVPMVQMSMTLAAVYLLLGFVSTKELRENVDWNMLVLIGSALGLAVAVRASGLSGAIAFALKHAHVGKRGMVFILFFFTMVITELVTNNAAAALCFPLASDMAKELHLKSVKPYAMTVMLATSASYMNPIGAPPLLMVMVPGNYTFKDFVKVGFGMDMICWITAGVFIPVMWSLETLPEETGWGLG